MDWSGKVLAVLNLLLSQWGNMNSWSWNGCMSNIVQFLVLKKKEKRKKKQKI